MPRTLKFGNTNVAVPGFGAMGLALGPDKKVPYEQAEKTLAKAVEIGCTFWDTAVVYGAGENERYIGRFLKQHDCRDEIFLASKCGFAVFENNGAVTNSAEHIRSYLAQSTERLGSAPDLYYLHRRDPNTPLTESIGTLDALRKEGKVKYIGLSECSAETLREACKIAKVDAVQAEYSAFETLHERDGLIEACRELDVAYVAYSPVGHGLLVDNKDLATKDTALANGISDRYGKNFDANARAVQVIRDLAEKKRCTTAQLAIAWVIEQGFIPIPGTTKAERVEANFKAGDITFDDQERSQMREIVDKLKPVGDRYHEFYAKMVGH